MRLPIIRAIARAERRSVRRLVRYWVFSVLAVLISFVFYMQYAAMHGFGSHLSATIGAMGPRYLISGIGMGLMIIFLLGLVFLAFDIRSRDIRERMAEVLDAHPVTNAEFIMGRGLGLVLMAWFPVLFTLAFLQGFGILALTLGWPLGDLIEPYSVLDFMLFSLSMLALWCSIVMLVSVLIRNRLIVAVVCLSVLGLHFWGSFQLPAYMQPTLGLFAVAMASDLVPNLLADNSGLQRVSLWLMAIGFGTLAVALHPRQDAGKNTALVAGAGILAVGILTVVAQIMMATSAIDQRSQWAAAHEARSAEPRVDIERIGGTVAIEPGDTMALDIQVHVLAPGRLDNLLFTFNPGLQVDTVVVAGSEVSFTHADGLLDIALDAALQPGDQTTVELKAAGHPATDFGYLDSVIDVATSEASDANLALLGTENGMFASRYVALTPGIRWLPKAGTDVPGDDPRTHPNDFFELDLEVEVPDGWLVAGPGRRESVGTDGETVSFRFRPGAPLPEVGLMASVFERRALEVAGIEFELLVNPKHQRNVAFFSDVGEVLEERLTELLADAERMGLAYPYNGFSLVESPFNLRGYRGGWRMDTAQAMPGMVLLRETSLPTSRFENEFSDPEQFEESDGGIAGAKIEALTTFFENDLSGGNVFLGASRNFLLHQASASGEGAHAVDFVLEELVNLLLTDAIGDGEPTGGYFSAHLYDQQFGFVVGQIATEMATGGAESIAQAVMRASADRASVWDRALGTPLAELEPFEEPEESLNVLALKCRAIAYAIADGLGRERTAAVVSELLRRYKGGHFTASDLIAVGADVGADLESVIGDWLHEAALPGFVASSVSVDRLADDESGNPMYQTRVHVRNDEPTPGLMRLRYRVADMKSMKSDREVPWETTDPIRFAGNQSFEIGVITNIPLFELWLEPYLSLNRRVVQLTIPEVDSETTIDEEPFHGPRPSEWGISSDLYADILVDDLDPSFAVEDDENLDWQPSGIQFGFSTPKIHLDQGLPEFQPMFGNPVVWSRNRTPGAWGKYRHTAAVVRGGEGKRRAVFGADIPRAGRWRLSYHIPEVRGSNVNVSVGPGGATATRSRGKGPQQGTYDIKLIDGNGDDQAVEFDGTASESGWNDLGEFVLPAGETRVVVSDKSDGALKMLNMVIADAIRWRPLDTPQVGARGG